MTSLALTLADNIDNFVVVCVEAFHNVRGNEAVENIVSPANSVSKRWIGGLKVE
jgi:hypothetical protein